MDPSSIVGIMAFLIFALFVVKLVRDFIKEYKDDKDKHHGKCYNCSKYYAKGDKFCSHCRVRIAGPCPGCSEEIIQPRGPICTQCGYHFEEGTAISTPSKPSTITRLIPNTSPSLTKIILSSCPNCRKKTSPGETFCGNCGENLLPISDTTVMREQN